jgi:hypothetical protein
LPSSETRVAILIPITKRLKGSVGFDYLGK